MKKMNNYLVTCVFLLLISASAASVYGYNNTNDNEDLVYSYTFEEPIIEKVTVRDEIFDKVTIEGLPNSYHYLKPSLPVKPLTVLLPMGTTVESIQVIPSKKINLGADYNVEIGGNLLPISKITTTKSIVEQSVVTENDLFEYIGVYYSRGFPILNVNLLPVQYDEKSGELTFFNKMDLVVKLKESKISGAFRGYPGGFEQISKIVDNPQIIQSYNSAKKQAAMASAEYLIITSNKFKNYNGENSFSDLLDLKESKGITTKIVTVEEIMQNDDYKVDGTWGDANSNNPFYMYEIKGNPDIFDDKAARIRNYIRYAYTELGTSYVLLAGDADIDNPSDNIVPARCLFANESGLPLNSDPYEEEDDIPSDVYYACLDGNFNYDCDSHFGESADRNDEVEFDEADFFAEVWVGRACVDSEQEISNFVKKTLFYEQTTDDSYLSTILFVGEDLGSAFYFQYGGDYKDMMEYLVPSGYNMHKLYDSEEYTWYPSDFIDELYSVQPQIINHDGHGYTNYMLKMHANSFYQFENEKPFFIYSHSCLTGAFDNFVPGGHYLDDDCIAEVITCEIPYGAFACILNARYGLGSEDSPVSPSGVYDESFYKALFTENIKELGAANHYSKEDNVWRINENGYRWAFYQSNLFGDPNLRIKESGGIAPEKPSTPSGKINGKSGVEYTYTTSTTHVNGGELYYWFDWGDDSNSGWVGPFESGEVADASHTWGEQGSYEIRVKAKNSDGIQSEWSDSLVASMPKEKAFSRLISLFERFPRFSILLSYFSPYN